MSDTRYNWERKFRHQLGLKSLAAFVLAALALSSLFGAWYRSVRSSNAIDELYYATVDSDAYDAIAHGFTSPDVLLSAASAVKDRGMDSMSGIDMWEHRNRFEDLPWDSGLLPYGSISGMDYHFDSVAPRKNGVASVYWEAEDGWNSEDRESRGLYINISFPAVNYGDKTTKGRVSATFSYDVKSKSLKCGAPRNWGVEHEGILSPTGRWISGSDYIKQHHIKTEKIAEDALTVIEDTLLPNFVNRGGSTSTHSADIEADGVTVDIDLSQLEQAESEQ